MKRTLIAIALLATGVAYVAHEAYAKDDAEEAAKEHAKLVEKYETKGGGKIFREGPYWFDAKKYDDSRLTVETPEGGNDSQQLLMKAVQASAAADQPPNIEILVWRYLQYKQEGNTRHPSRFTFKDADMTDVDPADLEQLTLAQYQSFTKRATDQVEKDNIKPKKKKVGPAKMMALAIGKLNDAEGRVRMEWYTWIDREWTYVVEAKLGNKVFEKDTFQDKLVDFVKNIKDLK